MLNIHLLLLKLILGMLGAWLGYRFLRWLVDKISFGRATNWFDRSKWKWTLGQFGQLTIIIGLIAILNLLVYVFRA